MTTFNSGDRVIWHYEPRGGYGYIIRVPAIVVSVSLKRIVIAAATKNGETKRVFVKPEKLSLKKDGKP